ncbi:MAG: XkdF-like putative serine protease domain-containing protein [Methanolobus sp.]|nr:XkdF-like putative serine protease domain-containing protein [Methanolobus sp.]
MAKKKVKKMTDTKVTHVSLVGNPANDLPFLAIKSNSDIQFNLQAEIAIKSEEKQLVYGIVYEPDRIDLQDEFMTAEDIQKSAHTFISDFGNIDANHDFESQMGVPVESYIAPQDFDIEGKTVKAGSWVLVVKCTDEAWERVKKGEFGGFSLAGTTKRQVVEVDVDEQGNVVKGLLNKIVDAFGGKAKNEADIVAEIVDTADLTEIQKSLEVFYNKIEGESVNTEEKLEALAKEFEALKSEMSEITKNFETNADVLEKMAEKVIEVEKSALNSQQVVAISQPVTKEKQQFNIVRGVKS